MGKGFDYAIQQLTLGKKMTREGWNGKDQYIEIATHVSFIDPQGVVHNVDHFDMGNAAIAFHGTSGIQLGWLASQADMLSEDWVEFSDKFKVKPYEENFVRHIDPNI